MRLRAGEDDLVAGALRRRYKCVGETSHAAALFCITIGKSIGRVRFDQVVVQMSQVLKIVLSRDDAEGKNVTQTKEDVRDRRLCTVCGRRLGGDAVGIVMLS